MAEFGDVVTCLKNNYITLFLISNTSSLYRASIRAERARNDRNLASVCYYTTERPESEKESLRTDSKLILKNECSR